MPRAIFTAVALLFVAIGAVAQEHDHSMMPIAQEEHLAHLRELVASMSWHGQVIPQPDSVGAAAARNFTVTAKSFDFSVSPSPFTVNQGDVVNLTLTVPSNDPSTVGHGILMETYIENGLDCLKGQSKQLQFTATTFGTFAFVCDIPTCGSGHSLMSGNFTVIKVSPAVSSIAPATGSQNGGTVVTITGTGFLTGATVKFGGTSATSSSVVSATSITAVTPLGPAGAQLAVNVVVTNPDSTTGTASNGFTYTVPALTVVSVTPNLAVPNAPVTIAIFGAGFTSTLASSVTVAGVAATNVQVIDPVTIQATLPSHAAGRGDVVVTIGATSATLQNGFSWQNPPPKRRAVKH